MMRRIFNFHGGVKLREHKRESTSYPVSKSSIPEVLVLPVNQHIGLPSRPSVNLGDTVLKGQVIAEAANDISVPLHAPTSGKIIAIENRPVPHPSGLPAQCIVIKPDGEDKTVAGYGMVRDYNQFSSTLSRKSGRQASLAWEARVFQAT